MEERIAPHLYKREYKTSAGEWRTLYYGKFKDWKGKRRGFALGSDLKTAKEQLKVLEVDNIKKKDFDQDHQKTGALTFAEWADKYPEAEGVKNKRSLERDRQMIRLHLKRFFTSTALTDFTRESLVRYVNMREGETVIRCGKRSKKKVARGTITNELACLHRMLKVAAREGHKVSVPSFEDLIIRVKRGGRALSEEEEKKVLTVYPKWLARLAEFARETCLSEGDLLRLTEAMVDRKACVVVPEGGRIKSGVKQVAPLTERARQVLDELKAEKKSGAIVANVNGLIFTREDGRPIDRSMISKAVTKAVTKAGVKKFTFHNYRNTALTDWSRQGIHVDVAMKAAGHQSVQMHQRYVDLQKEDVANAFGLHAQYTHRDESAIKESVTP